jgi:hypothetical protein
MVDDDVHLLATSIRLGRFARVPVVQARQRFGGSGGDTHNGCHDDIAEMKRLNVKLVLVEPYFDLKTPNSIGRATGAEVLVVPPSVGGEKEASDYIALFDYDINLLVTAIRKAGAR